jgi:hypothetical protein
LRRQSATAARISGGELRSALTNFVTFGWVGRPTGSITYPLRSAQDAGDAAADDARDLAKDAREQTTSEVTIEVETETAYGAADVDPDAALDHLLHLP